MNSPENQNPHSPEYSFQSVLSERRRIAYMARLILSSRNIKDVLWFLACVALLALIVFIGAITQR